MTPTAGTSLYAGGWIVPFALSPDGQWIAYTASSDDGRSRLWLRAFETNTGQPVPGSEGATGPFWSSDSAWLGYRASNTLYRVRVPGGSPEEISRFVGFYVGGGTTAAWSKDTILVPNGSLLRVAAQGGQPAAATTLDQNSGERLHLWPQFLSDGRQFLYVSQGNETRLMRHSLDGGKPATVGALAAASTIQYAEGYLFYVDAGVIWAQQLDEDAGTFVGERRRIAGGVPVGGPGAAPFSVSPAAVAYWTQSLIQQASELKWFDRRGTPTRTVASLAVYDGFDVSPDGSRLASAEVGKDGTVLWVHELATQGKFPLRIDAGATVPLWAPDNRHVAYMRRGALHSLNVDDPREGPVTLTTPSRNQLAQAWSTSGDQLLYEDWTTENFSDVMVLNVKTKRVTRLPWNTGANEFAARLSPDDHWVLYVTDQTGRPEVWIAAYPSGERKRQISHDGGTHPSWRRDGQEVYFVSADNQSVATPIDLETTGAKTGTATNLFRIPGSVDLAGGSHNVYKAAADGQSFLVSVKSAPVDVPPVSIILNWKQLVAD